MPRRTRRSGLIMSGPEVRGEMSAGYAVAELEAALAAPADPSAAGFFDVDNTMMQGASIYYLARGLAARKYFTTADLLRFGARQLRFRVLAAENGGDVTQAREVCVSVRQSITPGARSIPSSCVPRDRHAPWPRPSADRSGAPRS